MAIESLSSSTLRTLDVARSSRDKTREVKSVQDKTEQIPLAQLPVIRQGGAEAFQKAETFQQQAGSTSTSSLNEKSAIAAYQSIDKEQQRQQVQLLLGVDTFV